MSLIIGYKHQNKVVMMYDSARTYGSVAIKVPKDYTKVTKVNNDILLGFVGTVRDFISIKYLEEILQELTYPLSVDDVVEMYVNKIYKYLKETNNVNEKKGITIFDFSTLLAYKDQLFHISGTGHVFEVNKWTAVGTGNDVVFNYLPFNEVDLISEMKVVMEAVCNKTMSVGKPIRYIDTESLKHITL